MCYESGSLIRIYSPALIDKMPVEAMECRVGSSAHTGYADGNGVGRTMCNSEQDADSCWCLHALQVNQVSCTHVCKKMRK